MITPKMLAATFCVLVATAHAIPMVHVSLTPKDARYSVKAKCKNRKHVLLVNVAGAVPEKEWGAAAGHVAGLAQISTWTNSVQSISIPDLVGGAKPENPLDVVRVFVINDKNALTYLSAAGRWSIVNLYGLCDKNTESQVMMDRTAKMLLKGMALAAGCGASMEPGCALQASTFERKNFDAANITIRPTTFFAMLERLDAVGGIELTDCESDE